MWPDGVQTMSSPVRMTGTRTVLWKGMKRETTADVVLRLLQGQAVVGQLHFAA